MNIKLYKGNISKDIPENLVPHYLQMGWNEKKEVAKETKIEKKAKAVLNEKGI